MTNVGEDVLERLAQRLAVVGETVLGVPGRPPFARGVENLDTKPWEEREKVRRRRRRGGARGERVIERVDSGLESMQGLLEATRTQQRPGNGRVLDRLTHPFAGGDVAGPKRTCSRFGRLLPPGATSV